MFNVNCLKMNYIEKIINLGQQRNNEELKTLLSNSEIDELCEAAFLVIGKSNCHMFWNFLLNGFALSTDFRQKRFMVVLAVLKKLNEVELNTKQTFDIIPRLILDLPNFTAEQLVELTDLQMDALRLGDPKCIGWKDMLPQLLSLLQNMPEQFFVNDISTTGIDFCRKQIETITNMKWHLPIVVADLLRHISLNKEEKTKILFKLCEQIEKIPLEELPSLAFQLFSMCNSAPLLVIPLLAFDKYFYRVYYKKKLAEMDSAVVTYDSIDIYSEKDVQEAEETILYHLSACTEFVISEKDVVTALKGLTHTPHIILTPFLISAVITMCKINRQPDATRLSASTILPFLRNLIRNAEFEKEEGIVSAWCRNNTQSHQLVDMKKVFQLLIGQSKDGRMDVVTPGIVGLSFSLVKAKKKRQLNKLGSFFLQKFLKKRFIFGQGVIKTLAEFLFADHESIALEECFTELSLSNTFTMSECLGTMEQIIEHMLLIKGEESMRIMSFILPIVKISQPIRDFFIEVLRKAMYQRDVSTRKMSIFGFCMLLKQIKNNNSSRGSSGKSGSYTQSSISGLSIISQGSFRNRDNPQRDFDILTVEIIGILGKCLSQNAEMKTVMYEGLSRAVQLNKKIIPHILQFLENHFRTIFVGDADSLEIKTDLIVRESNGSVEVLENLGQLIQLIGTCLILAAKFQILHESVMLKDYYEMVFDNIESVTLDQLGVIGTLDSKSVVIGTQYIHCLEAFMAYGIFNFTNENEYLNKIFVLFKYRNECVEEMKKSSKKPQKRKRTGNESQTATTQHTRAVVYQEHTVWNFEVVERFLQVLHNEEPVHSSFPQAVAHQLTKLKGHREFVRFILHNAVDKIENLRVLPEYMHIKYSNRIFLHLVQCTQVIYKHYVERIDEICTADPLTAKLALEGFKQSLQSNEQLFGVKMPAFFQAITSAKSSELSSNVCNITENIQDTITKLIESLDMEEVDKNEEYVLQTMFECLELVYNNYKHDDEMVVGWYNWIYNFCMINRIDNKNFGIVHRILFNLRVRTHCGVFFISAAIQLSGLFAQIIEKPCTPTIELQSITDATKESCFIHLCNILRKQIEDTEYFTMKANSLCNLLKSIPEKDIDAVEKNLKSLEKAICSQLVHICNAVVQLSNSRIPLGVLMKTLLRIHMLLFVCLANVAKHFILKCSQDSDLGTLHGVKLDSLVKCTKPLANLIYQLIHYIEENIFTATTESKNPQADKMKVLRETKSIPALIGKIENFSKFISILSKKSKIDFTQFLHLGTVRDFKIKTKELLKAIEKELSGVLDTSETGGSVIDEAMEEVDDESETSGFTSRLQLMMDEEVGEVLDNNITKINKQTVKKQKL